MPPPMGAMPPPPGMMFPPGMPPGTAPGAPALPPTEEIWVENKTPDGKVNYRTYSTCCFYGGKVVKLWWLEIVDHLAQAVARV
jgi:hypothetical protein